MLAMNATKAEALLEYKVATSLRTKEKGGGGGSVIKVTTLASSGSGSLAAALAQTGPRIVVFDVSGVIEGDAVIESGDVTIAGQTAPGGGVTIHGRLLADYDFAVKNIIV